MSRGLHISNWALSVHCEGAAGDGNDLIAAVRKVALGTHAHEDAAGPDRSKSLMHTKGSGSLDANRSLGEPESGAVSTDSTEATVNSSAVFPGPATRSESYAADVSTSLCSSGSSVA